MCIFSSLGLCGDEFNVQVGAFYGFRILYDSFVWPLLFLMVRVWWSCG